MLINYFEPSLDPEDDEDDEITITIEADTGFRDTTYRPPDTGGDIGGLSAEISIDFHLTESGSDETTRRAADVIRRAIEESYLE